MPAHPGFRLALRVFFLSGALGFAFAWDGAAAETPRTAPPSTAAPEAETTFFESVDVQVIDVDVVVTDREGRPVFGLQQADFELLEDGKKVAISNFYGPLLSAAPTTVSPTTAGSEASIAAASPSPEPLPDAQRFRLAVFLDHRTLSAVARRRLGSSLEDFFLARLAAGDDLLIAGYDGDLRLHPVLQGSSAATAENLRGILREEIGRAARGQEIEAERRRILQDLRSAILPGVTDTGPDASEAEAASVYASIRLFAQARDSQNRDTLLAVARTVDVLAGLSGRKALLWIHGGMQMRPAESLFDAFQRKYEGTPIQDTVSTLEAFEHDASPALQAVAERANARRVTLYGLALPERSAGISAENVGDAVQARDLGRQDDFARESDVTIATTSTGGLAVSDPSNPVSFLARVRADLEAAYSLGYSPSPRAVGSLHRLEVRTRDRSLRVRHRIAGRERTTDERMAERTSTALLLESANDEMNPLDAAIEFEAERPAVAEPKGAKLPADAVQVSILVKVPMAKLVLLPAPRVHEGKLRIYVGARDAEARISDISVVDAPVRVPNENLLTALGQIAAVRVTLTLRQGEHQIAATVWDDLAKTESVVLARYVAGAPEPAVVPAN